jgi:hypothetical protein
METNQEPLGTVSQEQIQQWKNKYGEVYSFTSDNKICYLRKPDRKVLAYVSSIQNNPIKSSEAMVNNCWLGGCDDFKTDDSLFFGLTQKMGALIQIKEVELAKL